MVKRKGFTLIELLVVVAIIGVLATLAISGTMRFIMGQKETNTRTLIQTLDKALQKQWAKVISDAKKEPSSNIPSSVLNTLAGGDASLARVIWIKLRLMEAFPVTYAECNVASNPLYTNGYIPTTSQRKYIASYQRLLAGSTPTPGESAACLLMSLSVNKVLDPDSIATNLGQDSNGNKFILDGWGNPVLFYRFPTPDLSTWVPLGYGTATGMDPQSNNPAKNTAAALAGLLDPADPEGKLLNSNWNSWLNYNAGSGVYLFDQLCHPVHTGTTAATYQPFAWYITPVIASAGGDGKFGLTPPRYDPASGGNTNPYPFSINNSVDAGDNLYNYLLRLGATGN